MAKGITWNAVAASPVAAVRRPVSAVGAAAIIATALAGMGAAVAAHGSAGTVKPVGVGHNPWFADPSVSPTGSKTLPDMAAID
jgi:hypothetical protein